MAAWTDRLAPPLDCSTPLAEQPVVARRVDEMSLREWGSHLWSLETPFRRLFPDVELQIRGYSARLTTFAASGALALHDSSPGGLLRPRFTVDSVTSMCGAGVSDLVTRARELTRLVEAAAWLESRCDCTVKESS